MVVSVLARVSVRLAQASRAAPALRFSSSSSSSRSSTSLLGSLRSLRSVLVQGKAAQQQQRAFARGTQQGTTTATPTFTGKGVSGVQLAVGVAAAAGVIGLGAFGASMAAGALSPDFTHDGVVWPEYVAERVNATFRAFGTGIVFTAAAATAFYRVGVAARVAQMGMMGLIGTMVVTIGTMVAVQVVPPQNVAAKYAALALFNSCVGLTLSPYLVLGGPLLLRAAAMTAGIVGSLAFVAANSPSDKFLWMAGPLSMGLGAVVVSSLGAAFFPAARLAPLMMNVSLYGGLALFSAFVLYDTNVIVERAKKESEFDPVAASIGIYMDAVNIFIRLVTILANGGNRRR